MDGGALWMRDQVFPNLLRGGSSRAVGGLSIFHVWIILVGGSQPWTLTALVRMIPILILFSPWHLIMWKWWWYVVNYQANLVWKQGNPSLELCKADQYLQPTNPAASINIAAHREKPVSRYIPLWVYQWIICSGYEEEEQNSSKNGAFISMRVKYMHKWSIYVGIPNLYLVLCPIFLSSDFIVRIRISLITIRRQAGPKNFQILRREAFIVIPVPNCFVLKQLLSTIGWNYFLVFIFVVWPP